MKVYSNIDVGKWAFLTILFFLSCNIGEKENAFSNQNEHNFLTPDEVDQGWELLFDGKTLDGWRGLGRDDVPKEHWTIEDGTIRKLNSGLVASLPDGQPVEGGDLMTIRAFDNYELYFEWKLTKAGNTGLKYNVSEDISKAIDSPYAAIGFEYQLLDDKDTTYLGKLKPSQYTGCLYDMIAPEGAVVRPLGEYNSSKILVDGNNVEHWLNGKKVVQFEFGSQRLDSLFKQSKYKDIPNFHQKRKGHIVLQNHKDDAWFRNIKIREIETTSN
jgi:hypothetical protein